jgi:hypothetical protein
MRTGKKEEMNQLEKVKNTTVKNLNMSLKKELDYLNQDKSIEAIQWDFHHKILEVEEEISF